MDAQLIQLFHLVHVQGADVVFRLLEGRVGSISFFRFFISLGSVFLSSDIYLLNSFQLFDSLECFGSWLFGKMGRIVQSGLLSGSLVVCLYYSRSG